MKFKVNDKVKIIDEGESFTTYPKAEEWLKEIKSSKPYHYNIVPENGLVGIIKGMFRSTFHNAFILVIEIGDYSYLILESGVELIEDKTEFTFQEVIARIQPSEVYKVTNTDYSIKEISMDENNMLEIIGKEAMYIKDARFKLQESKKKVKIYKVEHTKNGKKYDFVKRNPFDNAIVYSGTLVQCDTKYGTSYGRCVGIQDMELTEEEVKEYKECWRAE